MPPVTFNVELFLGRHYKGDVITVFCVSAYSFILTSWASIDKYAFTCTSSNTNTYFLRCET